MRWLERSQPPDARWPTRRRWSETSSCRETQREHGQGFALLVGRDTSDLEEKEMVRAVVESVAENTVDAIVAPVLWAAVFGAPGTFVYRAVNTLDSMVGHRSERYARFGWASARADDFANWVPARLTALLAMAVRPRASARVWRAVMSGARHHPSPNAGVGEAAFAGALGIRVGGDSTYEGRFEHRPILGDGRPPEAIDIERAVRLSRDVSLLLAGGLAFAAFVAVKGGRPSPSFPEVPA